MKLKPVEEQVVVLTGRVRRLTGGIRVSFLGLSKRFTDIIKGLIGVIGHSGHEIMLEDECS